MVVSTGVRAAKSERIGNGLAALANKCAARTFDISSGMVYASMRDQIARAQLLVRDMKEVDPLCARLLIVGAGLAGASAAVHAQALGMEVVVLESQGDAFGLQANVSSRIVGPFMYEWPGLEVQSQSYPVVRPTLGAPHASTASWLSPSPLKASDLAVELRAWLNGEMAKRNPPKFYFNVKASETRKYVNDFVAAAASNGAFVPPPLTLPPAVSGANKSVSIRRRKTFLPDYVILAVGMGEERVHLVDGDPAGMRGLPFWCDDDLRSGGIADMNVAVFGAGDGALQDVLRALTKHDHPLDLIEALEGGSDHIKSMIDQVKPQLASLEHQSRLFATWSKGSVYELVDRECERICHKLASDPIVKAGVLSELRPGSGIVYHVYRERYLTRAYLLNRFCVHLIHACVPPSGRLQHMRYVRQKDTSVASASPVADPVVAGAGGLIKLSRTSTIEVQRLVVRFGPDKDWLATNKMVALSAELQTDRISMSAIPLPYVVST